MINKHDITEIPRSDEHCCYVRGVKHCRDGPHFPECLNDSSPFISLTLHCPLWLKFDYRVVSAGSSASHGQTLRHLTASGPLTGPPDLLHQRNINKTLIHTTEGVVLFPGDLSTGNTKQENRGDFIHGYRQGECSVTLLRATK